MVANFNKNIGDAKKYRFMIWGKGYVHSNKYIYDVLLFRGLSENNVLKM